MPKRKSSPTKAKQSPKPRSKSRSRSRSRSTTKKTPIKQSRSRSATKKTPTQRSRSQSSSRSVKSVTKVTQVTQKESPVRPPKPSPARTKTPPRAVEESKPTRVSRRIEERTTYQAYGVPNTPPCRSSKPEYFTTPSESLADNYAGVSTNRDNAARVGLIQSDSVDEPSGGFTPPSSAPVPRLRDVGVVKEVLVRATDSNNNAAWRGPAQFTKSPVTGGGDGVKEKSAGRQVTSSGAGWMGGFVVVFVIALTYYLTLSCSKTQCSLLRLPKFPTKWQAYINVEVAAVVVGFNIAVVLLSLIPVGSVVQGLPLKDGSRLDYRCNGWLALLVMAGCFGYAVQRGCSMTYLEDHYLQLVTSTIILALVVALDAFICGRNTPTKDWSPAADGTFLNDFVMGRVLHPRWKGIDYKLILLRSAVIASLLIDWMYLAASFKERQAVEPAIVFVVLGHTLYCLFAVKNESTLLSSNDFVKEGFGFLFVWGGCCFMSFMFSTHTRFLYLHPSEGITNKYALGALFIFNVIGLMFFVGANWQKNEFRRNPYNPELSHLSSIPTSTGKRLLISGWWGIVRRPNYLGDLMMALAWSVPCGCNYALPYLYVFYLTILLVTRSINDDASCQQRYGEAWDKYTSIVPYRLIPYIF